jgi:hypothetical protein
MGWVEGVEDVGEDLVDEETKGWNLVENWLLGMIYDNANAIMRFWVSLDPVYSCPACAPT